MMGYSVKLPNGIEVFCDSYEELKPILEHGGVQASVGVPATGASRQLGAKQDAPAAQSGPASDAALLGEFVVKGAATSETLQDALGKKSKGLPGALMAWAARVGIARDENAFTDIFESCKTQGQRGWRLTSAAMLTAKHVSGRDGTQ